MPLGGKVAASVLGTVYSLKKECFFMNTAANMALMRLHYVLDGQCKTCGKRPRANPDPHALTGLYCDECRTSGAKRRTKSRERARNLAADALKPSRLPR